MSSVAIFLSAASLALTPPVDLQPGSSTLKSSSAAPVGGACGPQFDPQFVRFVPAAPSLSGDGLLRLVSSPERRTSRTEAGLFRPGDLAGCEQMLTRSALRH